MKGVFYMDKELKNGIEKVICKKGTEIIEKYNFEDMNDREKYQEYINNRAIIEEQLKSSLTKEQYKLFIDFCDNEDYVGELELNYMFRAGVMAGFTNLHYLKEELGITELNKTINNKKYKYDDNFNGKR
jgi:hypothetical protein